MMKRIFSILAIATTLCSCGQKPETALDICDRHRVFDLYDSEEMRAQCKPLYDAQAKQMQKERQKGLSEDVQKLKTLKAAS